MSLGPSLQESRSLSGSSIVSLKACAGKFHFLMQDQAVNFTVLLELWPHSQEDVTAARNC